MFHFIEFIVTDNSFSNNFIKILVDTVLEWLCSQDFALYVVFNGLRLYHQATLVLFVALASSVLAYKCMMMTLFVDACMQRGLVFYALDDFCLLQYLRSLACNVWFLLCTFHKLVRNIKIFLARFYKLNSYKKINCKKLLNVNIFRTLNLVFFIVSFNTSNKDQ